MPLIILGLIVVLGAALLIYYQLGPKVTLKLKNARGGGGFGGFGAYNGDDAGQNAENGDSEQAVSDSDMREAVKKSDGNEGKVIFIFGDGESEERPIRDTDKDDGQDKE